MFCSGSLWWRNSLPRHFMLVFSFHLSPVCTCFLVWRLRMLWDRAEQGKPMLILMRWPHISSCHLVVSFSCVTDPKWSTLWSTDPHTTHNTELTCEECMWFLWDLYQTYQAERLPSKHRCKVHHSCGMMQENCDQVPKRTPIQHIYLKSPEELYLSCWVSESATSYSDCIYCLLVFPSCLIEQSKTRKNKAKTQMAGINIKQHFFHIYVELNNQIYCSIYIYFQLKWCRSLS